MVPFNPKLKLGFLIPDVGFSQLSYYLVKNLNQLILDKPQFGITVFFENPQPVFTNLLFPLMHISEAYEVRCPLIATSLSTADKLIHFPGCRRKLFYVWDLEWIRIQNKQYSVLENIYRNKELKLIARSSEHADLIKECWNISPAYILDDFDIKGLENILDVTS